MNGPRRAMRAAAYERAVRGVPHRPFAFSNEDCVRYSDGSSSGG